MACVAINPLALNEVLARPDIWRGGALSRGETEVLASGYAELDAALPGGGWPRGALAEILVAAPTRGSATRAGGVGGGIAGVGELALLLPALARHTQEGSFAALIAPPARLHAPAWAAAGIDLARLIVVDPARGEGGGKGEGDAASRIRDALWASEQALRSGGVGFVIAWLPQADSTRMKRLQLAAESGHACAVVFRPDYCARQSSPAPLRLLIAGSGEGTSVRILKRRGPPLATPLAVPVDRPRRSVRIRSLGFGVSTNVSTSALTSVSTHVATSTAPGFVPGARSVLARLPFVE